MNKQLHSTDPLTVLDGIGAVKSSRFAALGVTNLGELCELFPKSYRQNKVTRLIDAVPDEPCGFCFTVLSLPSVSYYPGGKRLLRFTAGDDSGKANIIFFNQPYLKNRFVKGDRYFFYGVLRKKNSVYSLYSPEFEDMSAFREGIHPIYPSAEGLSQNAVRSAVNAVLPYADILVKERLPSETVLHMGFSDRACAVRELHSPTSAQALISAKRRLIFEEMFFFSLRLRLLRDNNAKVLTEGFHSVDMAPFFRRLGFEPTPAQRRAIDEISQDLIFEGQKPVMNRLLEGDVGSGKTAVAAAAIYITVRNNKNAVLMAPTEILAKQHFASLGELFRPLGIRTLLLTGSTKIQRRREISELLSGSERFLIVGTHALIEDSVCIPHIGLTVTDEQHRFGVRQRERLSEKAECRNMLFLSATPIPRTLALFLFADKSISVIDTLPPGRKKTETYLVTQALRERTDAFIDRQLDEGHQVYVVCPLISDSDSLSGVLSAEGCYSRIKERFPNRRVGFLNGKMKPEEKDRMMTGFSEHKLDILVSTSVIEVGINVPNATLMLIENAERFGLSTLHQLRGRVGRGADKSYCILMAGKLNDASRERLETLRDTDDGFRLAEFDLKTRGPGDFFGVAQTGRLDFSFFESSVFASSSESVTRLISSAKSEADMYADRLTPAEKSRLNTSDALMN